MRTVWYYTITQNKKKLLHMIFIPLILLFVTFIVSVFVDRMFPEFNQQYMKWPDMTKDLLGLAAWNSNLYVNLWQLMALVYPLFHIYDMMTGLTRSIIEEERLETIVYLHNLSLGRGTVLGAKASVWLLHTLLCMVIMFAENLLFLIILQAGRMIPMMGRYYVTLFVICLLYITIALFIASYEEQERASYNTILGVLIVPLLIARTHAVIRFVSALLVATNRGGNLTDKLDWLVGKLKLLEVLCPMAWCWPGERVSGLFVICGLGVAVVMLTAAVSIYNHRNMINME